MKRDDATRAVIAEWAEKHVVPRMDEFENMVNRFVVSTDRDERIRMGWSWIRKGHFLLSFFGGPYNLIDMRDGSRYEHPCGGESDYIERRGRRAKRIHCVPHRPAPYKHEMENLTDGDWKEVEKFQQAWKEFHPILQQVRRK